MKRLTPVMLVVGSVTLALGGLIAARPAKSAAPKRTSTQMAVAFDVSAPLEQFIPDKTVVVHASVQSPPVRKGETKGPGTALGMTGPIPPAARGGAGANRGAGA